MKKWISTATIVFLIIGFASTALAADADYDGVEDGSDNCPSVYNPNQEDTDYITYKRLKRFTAATDTFTESGVSISESSGVFTGTNIEFVCDTCDIADFSGTTYSDIGTTSGLCGYTTNIITNIIDNDDQICGQSSSGLLYNIDITSSNDGTCYPDSGPEVRYCQSPVNPSGYSSYIRDEITAVPDGTGDACDCGTDGSCTALTYCIEQSTEDADCILPVRQWNSGDPIEVSDTAQHQIEPRLVQTTDNNYVVGWVNDDVSTGASDIYVQKINASTGALMWGSSGIQVTPTAGDQPEQTLNEKGSFELITDNDNSNTGGVFLAWDDDNSDINIYVQRLDTDGDPVSGWPSLPGGKNVYADGTTTTTYELEPHILEDGNGYLYVAWTALNSAQDSSLIHVTRLNGSGVLDTSWNTGGTNDFKTVTLDGTNGSYGFEYVASLEPYHSGGNSGVYVTFVSTDNTEGELFIAQLNDDGSAETNWNSGNILKISDSSNEILTDISAETIPDGSGGINVVYQYYDSTTSDMGLKAQKANNTGETQWPSPGGSGVTLMSHSSGFIIKKHFITTDNLGGVISIASADTGSNVEIWVRRVSALGALGPLEWLTDYTAEYSDCTTANSYGGTRVIADDNESAIYAYNCYYDGPSDSGLDYPSIILQKIDSGENPLWGDSTNDEEYIVLGNEFPAVSSIMDAKAVLAPGSTAVAWQQYRYLLDKYNVYIQLLTEQAGNPCGEMEENAESGGNIYSEACLSFDVYAGPLALEYLPSTITFPTKFYTTLAQPSFSNDNPATPGVDVATGPEDIITVDDFSNTGGFELTISVSSINSDMSAIPYENLYAVTSYPSSSDLTSKDAYLDGTASGGVVYADGTIGTQDIVSSIHTDSSLNPTSTYTTDGSNFDSDSDDIMNPISLMSTSTAHSGRFSQALSLYLEIPENQPPGDYDMALTLDLIAN
jgi:hypothetical protein